MGQYEVKHILCSVQEVWWSLLRVLQPGWAGGLWSWCGFAEYWSFPVVVEVPLSNHSTQSPASALVASPGHALGH